jgi:peptidoglycan DL-endopeptidase CwlO
VFPKLMAAAGTSVGIGLIAAAAIVGGSIAAPGGSSVPTGGIGASCAGVCGVLTGASPAGPADRFGLPAGYAIPDDADPAERVAVEYALAQLGKPYVWGAAGPDAFDCSGLTMMAWAAAGVALAHYTVDQFAEGTPVADLGLIAPGDLVLVPGSDGTLAAPGHVGIYIGQSLVESAVDPAEGVIVATWAAFTAGGLSGVRHVG